MTDDIPAVIANIESLAAKFRALTARTGRKADEDAAQHFEFAAEHLKRGNRRLVQMQAEQAAQEAVKPKRRPFAMEQFGYSDGTTHNAG